VHLAQYRGAPRFEALVNKRSSKGVEDDAVYSTRQVLDSLCVPSLLPERVPVEAHSFSVMTKTRLAHVAVTVACPLRPFQPWTLLFASPFLLASVGGQSKHCIYSRTKRGAHWCSEIIDQPRNDTVSV
jgi:hypothetical protein